MIRTASGAASWSTWMPTVTRTGSVWSTIGQSRASSLRMSSMCSRAVAESLLETSTLSLIGSLRSGTKHSSRLVTFSPAPRTTRPSLTRQERRSRWESWIIVSSHMASTRIFSAKRWKTLTFGSLNSTSQRLISPSDSQMPETCASKYASPASQVRSMSWNSWTLLKTHLRMHPLSNSWHQTAWRAASRPFSVICPKVRASWAEV